MIQLRWYSKRVSVTAKRTRLYAEERGIGLQQALSELRDKQEHPRLQYRQMVNATIYAGMPTEQQKLETANYQWTEWIDVPQVFEVDGSDRDEIKSKLGYSRVGLGNV